MAILDMSSALNAMVEASLPGAQRESALMTALFSDKVNSVVDSAIEKLMDTQTRVQEMVAKGTITPEQGQRIIAARQAQVENAERFAGRYFS